MNCQEAEICFSSFLDGTVVSVPEGLERHIDTCSGCRERYGLLKVGHEAVVDSIPFLAPERSYLTPRRLLRLVEAAAPAGSAPSGVRGMRSRRLGYYAAAAAFFLIVGGAFLLRSGPEPGEGPGDVAALTPRGARTVTFHLVSGFDRGIEAVADLSDMVDWEFSAPLESPENPSAIGSPGTRIPVRETGRLRQDDYWW